MRTLYVAAGGGGDAVGALLARRALGDTDEHPPLVTTCAWERLRIDPVPGPRARADFTGLGLVGGEPCEVLPDSNTVPPGRSVLPLLAKTSGARIFLHDFEGGAVGLASQLQRLAAALDVNELVVVDVGGDVMAKGPEPELRSPLADSLTLAASIHTSLPTSVVVLGPGADGELSEVQVVGRLEEAGAALVGRVTADDVRALEPVLTWHPTEATALAAAAAIGMRGAVAMRRGRIAVPITNCTSQLWRMPRPRWPQMPLAGALRRSDSLTAVERIMRDVSVNEIDFERRVAGQPSYKGPGSDLRGVVSQMENAGAGYITDRRLSEALPKKEYAAIAGKVSRSSFGMWSLERLRSVADMQN